MAPRRSGRDAARVRSHVRPATESSDMHPRVTDWSSPARRPFGATRLVRPGVVATLAAPASGRHRPSDAGASSLACSPRPASAAARRWSSALMVSVLACCLMAGPVRPRRGPPLAGGARRPGAVTPDPAPADLAARGPARIAFGAAAARPRALGRLEQAVGRPARASPTTARGPGRRLRRGVRRRRPPARRDPGGHLGALGTAGGARQPAFTLDSITSGATTRTSCAGPARSPVGAPRPPALRPRDERHLVPLGRGGQRQRPGRLRRRLAARARALRPGRRTNVTWVWSPNISTPARAAARAVPGRRAPSTRSGWTATTAARPSWGGWRTFPTLFGPSADRGRGPSPTGRVVIGEAASAERGGDKAAWTPTFSPAWPPAPTSSASPGSTTTRRRTGGCRARPRRARVRRGGCAGRPSRRRHRDRAGAPAARRRPGRGGPRRAAGRLRGRRGRCPRCPRAVRAHHLAAHPRPGPALPRPPPPARSRGAGRVFFGVTTPKGPYDLASTTRRRPRPAGADVLMFRRAGRGTSPTRPCSPGSATAARCR